MKKIKQHKNFIIAMDKEERFQIFTKDEWSMGKGFRYAEHDACTVKEALEFIDDYGN